MPVVFDDNSGRRIGAATRQVESWAVSPGGRKRDIPNRTGAFKPFLARATATAVMGSFDSRFVYTIEEVTLDITTSSGVPTEATVTLVTDGRTGKAINLAEMANEADTGIAFGVDRAGADYPAGFDPRPITGGGEDNTHRTNQIVWILGRVVVDESGTPHTIYCFDRQGHHDGACAAP